MFPLAGAGADTGVSASRAGAGVPLILAGAGAMQDTIIMDGAAAFLSFQGKFIHPSNLYMGAINKQGQEVIPANYRALSPFREGRALIVDREGRFGMIDRSGKVVIPASYDELGPFEKDRAPFAYDKHWGFIDETNKIVIENRFTKVTPFVSDAAAVLEGGKAALIDRSGANLVAPQEAYSDVGTYAQDRFPVMVRRAGNGDIWTEKEILSFLQCMMKLEFLTKHYKKIEIILT